MKTLNIITPASRLSYVEYIYEDLKNYSSELRIFWYVIIDRLVEDNYFRLEVFENLYPIVIMSPYEKAEGGHLHRNYVYDAFLNSFPESWIYQLDDDNLIHPNFIDFFKSMKSASNVFIFGQQRANGSLRLKATKVATIGKVDTAMVLFRAKCMEHFRFKNKYDDDGRFISYLTSTYKDSLNVIDAPMCWYNKLRT